MATTTQQQDAPGVPEHRPVRDWLLQGLSHQAGNHPGPHVEPSEQVATKPWWKVMCLTGVDYFSTLGYQPGIAALAAGVLSPVATLVLVALTLLGALPVYRRVAAESPRGEGSIAMLERLLTFWKGKVFVLVLLGFAATDFIITMTLSAADATAHVIENPYVPEGAEGHRVLITLGLLALLGAVFLRGFSEAIGIAVGIVAVYLTLNTVVVVVGLWHVVTTDGLVGSWTNAVSLEHSNPVLAVGVALLVFPRLALGLSGFETGVAVMPSVAGDPGDTEAQPTGRIRGTRRMLTTAALIMSVFLVTSSIITTFLIPQQEFEPGGEANGRALAYLAHEYLGNGFGTLYDVSTIVILWFAGASAMAGLLNLVPRYLPRYGMAPTWARAVRPLVLVLTGAAFFITWVFDADVDAQGGAYATGVLVLMTSASVAVTLSARRAGQRRATIGFGVIAAIFVYTTAANVVERPDGIKIGALFIAAIIAISLVSRLSRSFELRVTGVVFDERAELFLRDCSRRRLRLIANEPDSRDVEEYRTKLEQIRKDHDIPDEDVVFVEVTVSDPSDFEGELAVRGQVVHGRFRVLTCSSPTVPNALAALLLAARDRTGAQPHIYFEWTEGNPVANFLRYLLFGVGEVAPMTREVLREAEPVRARRPHVHVG
ncbi:amino acid transporter [Modestobacter sp. I12A-02628]|uniref:Amino acid transporter n=1 Tax=Goekera deserti TaxID=2497753 RepID=A0A7K3W9N9_9ACTN|nr:amino acid transporter [Goekera deserti]MPQ98865.1 amino acid transporter [Goekera deserti]NDI49636.1 amino acid transporter [Goekera deserti]NEL53171.1 amino acid transporter [Goekera deserti]